MESILAALNNPIAIVIFLIGGGGITTLLTAWIGWRQTREKKETTFSPTLALIADRIAFERLSAQVERLADLIEKAMDKYELIKMIEGLGRRN